MASTDPTKSSFTTQTEKPNHYTYLKEFRVDQCPSFLQHKCNQHRPFVCFHWHFMNQRRRRPVRRRDGSFNYSADNYCPKYDETTGICPDGDDCPFLHRTAGDTERRYHLRYYKTCMCVHDTDARGYCVKNGHHCAFAHGIHDQRPPVYDIKELEALQNVEEAGEGLNGPNVLDKERNLMNEDPKWQDTNYVLAHYKTEPCKRPPRLCRQGYACPQFHNSKDKRRSPRKFKYRSTPCPNVKHGEEWGEPANCEAGDNCQYCHTRTEQQFHPEIYKSTKCNDVQQAGYCPRSVFCAFAHVEPYIVMEEEPQNMALTDMRSSVLSSADGVGPSSGSGVSGGGNSAAGGPVAGSVVGAAVLGGVGGVGNGGTSGPNVAGGSLVSAVVGSGTKKDSHDLGNLSYFQLLPNGSAESSESASTSSLGSNNSSHNKAPGSHLQQQKHNATLLGNGHGGNPLGGLGLLSNGGQNTANCGSANANSLLSNIDFNPDLSKQIIAIDNDLSLNPIEREQRKRMACLTFNILNVGSPLDGGMYDLARRDNMHGLENSISGLMPSGLLASSSAPVNIPGSSVGNSITGILQGTSAPVNIPGSSLGHNFSPSSHSNLFGLHDPFGAHHIGSGSAPKLSNNSYGHNHNDNFFFHSNNIISPVLGDGLSASPEIRRMSDLPLSSELSSNTTNLLFGDNQHHQTQQAQQSQQQHLHHQAQQSQQQQLPQQQQSQQQQVQQQAPQQQQQQQMMNWEERLMQATTACEAWKAQMEESNRKTVIAEQQRDEALSHVKALKEQLEQQSLSGNGCASNYRVCELRGMPLSKLKNIQAKLRKDMEEVETVLYQETANKCMKCEEKNRSVTLVPCNHLVVCDTCATTQRECPYCQTPVTPKA
ncbi:RING finger protein unkempt homolog [Anopheles nili]|uniref:RING finger protein unkempt homolog n=1 Tax=Anopheles nili TaxID=185578 RepID=UPI00237B7D7E|nr:RING finger protein unkempt homolog [Anopheles nili]